jgi:undecaprenyl-diphosphatase
VSAAEDHPRGARPRPSWLRDAERIDVAVYAAIARTSTPALDRAMARLSHAADYSRLSIGSATALALAGGERGRRAATFGLASVAITATVINVVVKPLGRRRRPDRDTQEVPLARHVRMPISSSFPSGHSAAAFAFASGVGHVSPIAGAPLLGLAGLVAYSRVHTGVHYPADAVAGSLIGAAVAEATSAVIERSDRIALARPPERAGSRRRGSRGRRARSRGWRGRRERRDRSPG